MKEKIFNKMIEYGWNLEDFNKIYNYHYNRLNNKWETLENKKNITENEELELEDLRFITDFLRAINDIDNTKLVGTSKISLTNEHNIPLSLGYITYGNVAQLETEIRKCKFNANDIIYMLNNNKQKLTNYWQVELETDNLIILKSKDNYYLEIMYQ